MGSYIVKAFVLEMLGIFNNKMPLYNRDVLPIVERTSAERIDNFRMGYL